MTGGSLFSGVGGFELGLLRSGLITEVKWQVEIDGFCQRILAKHFPDTKRYADIRDCGRHNLDPVDVIFGGDPCPVRSRARAHRPTIHPDLSGYFLAVVGGLRPRWVLRENVPASDDTHFQTALELLGYRTVVIRANAAPFTGQNRVRDFIVGCVEDAGIRGFEKSYVRQGGLRPVETGQGAEEGYPCLTTHDRRYDARDGYIWEGRGYLRVADRDERTKLSGFPEGWLGGLSNTRVARVTGNAVVPQVAEAIGRIIKEWVQLQPTTTRQS